MSFSLDRIASLLSDDGVLMCTKDWGCTLIDWPVVNVMGIALAVMTILLGGFLSRFNAFLAICYAMALLACVAIIAAKLQAIG